MCLESYSRLLIKINILTFICHSIRYFNWLILRHHHLTIFLFSNHMNSYIFYSDSHTTISNTRYLLKIHWTYFIFFIIDISYYVFLQRLSQNVQKVLFLFIESYCAINFNLYRIIICHCTKLFLSCLTTPKNLCVVIKSSTCMCHFSYV